MTQQEERPEIVVVDLSDPRNPTEERRPMTDEEWTNHKKMQDDAKKLQDAEDLKELTKTNSLKQAIVDFKNATSIAQIKAALAAFHRAKGDFDGLE